MPDDSPILLDRDMVIDAMTELAATLRERGVAAGIRLVGGAAIAIQYDRDRKPTTDVDAFLHPAEVILEAAAEMSAARGWKPDWLNDKVLAFATHHDTPEDWTVVIDGEGVTVYVASAELLFAMKANACRGVRDGRDLLTLADVCGITTIDQAEEVFERYFPQDLFKAKGLRWLQAHFRGEDPFDL